MVYLGATNVLLAVFNVIPAAPLDGGRVLRAIVWWRTGDRVKATIWADRAGQVFGWICVVTGLVTLDRIKHVPTGKRDHTRLADVACPLADVATATPQDSVADILPHLTECADRRALVFSNGHLAGIIITPSDITRMIDNLGLHRPP